MFEKKSKVEVGTTLEAFAQVGVRDATLATRVLKGVLEELAKQKKCALSVDCV